eukprot:Seg6391.3 transcript_id=Seg6391.3/GoldUCD/mRNA.D3Y31 product="hypothetical protein" protein_id=Seg6391.3/GoldUCD/D3Y31
MDTCRSITALFLAIALATVSPSQASIDGKTLVLLENVYVKETHSIFFNFLQGKSAHCD